MTELIPSGTIESKIFSIRGLRVMLDKDLAELYGVATGNLNKAVNRNLVPCKLNKAMITQIKD